MAEERHDAAFIVGAVVGGVAAGVYALLEAPQAGVRTRFQLQEQADAISAQVAREAAEVDERVRRWLVRVDEQTAPFLRRVTGSRAARAVTRERVATERPSPSERQSVVETEPFVTLPGSGAPEPVGGGPPIGTEDAPADAPIDDAPRLTNAPR